MPQNRTFQQFDIVSYVPEQISDATASGSDATISLESSGIDGSAGVQVYLTEDTYLTINGADTAVTDLLKAGWHIFPWHVSTIKHQAVSAAGIIIVIGKSV